MPGFAGKPGKPYQKYDLNHKRGKNKGNHPQQHAGRRVVRGTQLPTYGGKAVGPGTGRVKGVSDIGKLLPGGPGKGQRGNGRKYIEDRRGTKLDRAGNWDEPQKRRRRGGA